MSSELIFNPAIKRVHHKRKSGGHESPPPIGLTIASVSVGDFVGPTGHLTVTFAMPAGATLNSPAAADPAQWTVIYDGTLYRGVILDQTDAASVTIFFEEYASATSPDVLNYSADPSDISDSLGQHLGAVVNYPI